MTGEDKPKGGISSFSIGLGDGTHQAAPVSPAPPFRVLIAGDFGLAAGREPMNITGLDTEELLEPHRPEFTVRAANLLGSHPAELEEHVAFKSLKDLRPREIFRKFRFVTELEGADAESLATHGQTYDKVVAAIEAERSQGLPAERDLPEPDTNAPSGGKDGLDGLFSMMDTSANENEPSDPASRAKSAVDAFIQRTLREDSRASETRESGKPAQAKELSPVSALVNAQSALFFDSAKLRTVLKNWHSLKLLLSEIPFTLPLELHLLQLDHDLDPLTLAGLVIGPQGALQAELYNVVLFANPTGLSGQDADALKVVAKGCVEADTVGMVSLDAGFAGVAGEELASMDAAGQLLEEPGFEGYQGLRETDAAAHLSLFWNEARLTEEDTAWPAIFASSAWIALAEILTGLETEIFPRVPVGTPVDFDALEVAESRAMGKAVATAARFLAGPGTAPSLAQCGINVMEGVANRTALVFRRAVTLRPGKEGRGPLDQALLVSRLFTLFQEALGGALSPGQSPEDREAAVRDNLDRMSGSLGGQVSFQVKREAVEDQDLINVTAAVLGGWAAGQQHTFYLPASDG